MNRTNRLLTLCLLVFSCDTVSETGWAQTLQSPSAIAVGPQYDTAHVYVPPSDVDSFVASFLGTLGGTRTKQVIATVTPTPSKTISQLLQTPVGTVSLFGFFTPIPVPFGEERTGYLVTNMDAAIQKARNSGAEIVVTPFPDPIGIDAVIRFPGGVMTQLYWHTSAPSYAPFLRVPENRVYVSPDDIDKFLRSFLAFSGGRIVLDQPAASGKEIGLPSTRFRRVQVESTFGKLLILVTNQRLPAPYGRETTGYEVDDVTVTLQKATSNRAKVLVPPIAINRSTSANRQWWNFQADISLKSTRLLQRRPTDGSTNNRLSQTGELL